MRATLGIPAYNEEKNIKMTLEQAIANRPKDVEIIVVSDGSTDNTDNIIKGFSKKGVKLISKKNAGKVAALNDIAKKSKGDIVILQDADTSIEKDYIENIIKKFDDKKIGMIVTYGLENNKSGFCAFYAKTLTGLQHAHNIRTKNTPKAFGGLYAIRRKLFQELPEKVFSDGDYNVSAVSKKGFVVKYCPDIKFYTLFPTNFKSLAKWRERVFIGQSCHKLYHGNSISTHNPAELLSTIIQYLKENIIDAPKIFAVFFLEACFRFLAYRDIKKKRDVHIYERTY